MSLHQAVFATFALLACCFAIVRGGAPERITAAAFLIAYLVTITNPQPGSIAYRLVEWSVASSDMILLVLLIALALKSTRYWTIPMASLQLIGVLAHVAKALDSGIEPIAYYLATAGGGWPMTVLLLLGAIRHIQRRKRLGIDPAWVSQLPRAYRAGWQVNDRPTKAVGH